MRQNFKVLNILLTLSLASFILCTFYILSLPLPHIEITDGDWLNSLTDGDWLNSLMTGGVIVALVLWVISGILYHVFLGILVSKKNRSVIKWVGLSVFFAPLGLIISYPLMLWAKPLPKEEIPPPPDKAVDI